MLSDFLSSGVKLKPKNWLWWENGRNWQKNKIVMAIIGVQPPFSSKNSATKSQSPTSYRRCWLLWMEEGFWHNWFWVSIHCFSVALKQFSTCNMYWGAPRLPPTSSAALPNEYQKTGGRRGTFIIWVLIDFLTTLLNFFIKKFMGLKQLCGVESSVGSPKWSLSRIMRRSLQVHVLHFKAVDSW